jgi:uncharacterized protein YbjT (DUF2867 family)
MADRLKVLVYGGTGSQSSPVVWELLERGHQPYVFTRNAEKAKAMQDAGAEIVVGDMGALNSVRGASMGMDAVSLMIPAFIPNPMDYPKYAQNALQAAKEAGIKLLVYNTSGPVITDEFQNPMYGLRNHIIQSIQSSGIPYIILQPGVYLENLFGPWTRPAIIERSVLPYPVEENTRLGWIASEDVGKLTVAALEHPELAGSVIPISGIENVTGPELAAAFSRGLGRTITYDALPLDEFAAAMDAMFGEGVGAGAAQGYQYQRDNGHRMTMWVDMEPILQKLPVAMTSIEDWARKHVLAFSRTPEGHTA